MRDSQKIQGNQKQKQKQKQKEDSKLAAKKGFNGRDEDPKKKSAQKVHVKKKT